MADDVDKPKRMVQLQELLWAIVAARIAEAGEMAEHGLLVFLRLPNRERRIGYMMWSITIIGGLQAGLKPEGLALDGPGWDINEGTRAAADVIRRLTDIAAQEPTFVGDDVSRVAPHLIPILTDVRARVLEDEAADIEPEFAAALVNVAAVARLYVESAVIQGSEPQPYNGGYRLPVDTAQGGDQPENVRLKDIFDPKERVN